jgi:hypothetical protein
MTPSTMSRCLRHALSILLGAAITCSLGRAHGNPLPLEDISRRDGMNDVGALLDLANQYAHSTDNKLKYTSDSKGDRKTFSGKWQAPTLPGDLAGKYVYGMALLSDDGCNVEVNQKRVLSLFEKPIALPDIANSLHILDVRIEPGSEADIRIEYANVKYTPREGAPDIDGCTLFVYLKAAGDVHLGSVGFSGDGFVPLCGDTTLQAYPAPQWKDNDGDGLPDRAGDGGGNDSVAYVKNSQPSIAAVFKVGAMQPADVIEFRATERNSMRIPPVQLPVVNGVATLPATPLVDGAGNPARWPDLIKIYRKSDDTAFTLNWDYRINGQDWIRFASSKHQVYITAAMPTVVNKQETLFYYACNRADGDVGVDGKAVTHKIYEDFKTLEMKRVDRFSGIPSGVFLTFWPDPQKGEDSNNLIKVGTGVCGAWANFFNDTLSMHGYKAFSIGLVAKDIIFSDGGMHDGACWIPILDPQVKLLAGNAPVSGQGGSAFAPASWPTHKISFAFDEYYDPSYGVGPCASKADYEDSAIKWYAYPIEFDKHGDVVSAHWEERVKKAPEKLNYKSL